jgi:hypothetical protein
MSTAVTDRAGGADPDPPADLAGSSRLERWWQGRYGWQLLIEIGVMFLLLTLYRYGRYLARNDVVGAFRNADDILALEDRLGIANEQALQRLLLDHLFVVKAMNRYYAMAHFPVSVGFLAVTYVRAPTLYRHVRAVFIAVTAAGLLIHVVYPLAPPRMLGGFVDTIRVWGPSIYEKPGVSGFANQFAAMPSLHVAWATIVAYGAMQWKTGRWRWLRWVLVAHPVITTLAVVVTANHYWADAIVAWALVLVAIVACRAWEARTADRYAVTSAFALK